MTNLLSATLAALLAALPIVALQRPPGDCEVRTWKDSFTNDTLTALTLMLKGPRGPLPINLSITTRRKLRMKAGEPIEVRLEFYMPLFVGSLDLKPPHVLFVFDEGTEDEITYSASVEPTAPIHAVSRLGIASDIATLAQFGKAATIDGRLFGVEFSLTGQQIRAVSDFARRELRRDSSPGASQ